ncbi:sulfatase family protein [Pontiella sulfatireligans]|uniref:Arylsulfatase n=1 Tax=Pontiella sulfatireligans TaxID=2750658 RepID=A0A6C2UPY2_9BACT|nr:sulfatase-like hydrolase/transferase [Pontiella sulfatireligans]SPS74499.1 sulfatase S1_51 [Kiritimatiellales bacterium]VGO22335.1 Arylsulfatase [Pontiella sulfatireligans]
MLKKFISLSFMLGVVGSASAQPPNIVLMYVDDLDFDQVSVYDTEKFPSYTGAKMTGNLTELSPVTAFQNGRFLKPGEMSYYKNPTVLTPNVQRLSDEGVVLDRFYLTTSVCTPSRYSLLTGRYASRSSRLISETPPGTTPLLGWNSHMDPQENNLAKDLKAAGYKTGLVGKWHLNDYDIPEIDFASGYGGHHTRNGTAKGLREFQLVGSYFQPTADYGDPAVQKEIGRIYDVMQKRVQRISGFDVVDRLYYANYGELPIPKHMKAHNLEWLTEGALEFIDKNKEEPFFLYFSITAPHGQYFEDWMEKDWRVTPAGMLSEKPKGMPPRESVLRRIQEAGLPLQNSMATWIDDSLGALLTKLDETGLSENTIVLFLSDHQSRGKLTVHEGHRAPGVIRWPGHIDAGSREGRIISNIDMLPSLLDAAGSKPSADAVVDGRNFFPILGKNAAWRDSLLLETSYSRAVVSKDWKYIAHRPPQEVLEKMEADRIAAEKGDGRRHVGWSGRTTNPASGMGVRFNADQDFPHYFDPDQLYDLGNDVFEQNNVIANPENKERLEQLKQQLDSQLKKLPHTFGEFGAK